MIITLLLLKVFRTILQNQVMPINDKEFPSYHSADWSKPNMLHANVCLLYSKKLMA